MWCPHRGFESLSFRLNTKSIGNVSEALCLAKFVSRGWIVLQPFGDNERYDLVIDRGNGFETIQVKTGRATDNGCFTFNSYSTVGRVGNGVATSYRGEVDYFAVVFNENVYLISVDEVPVGKPYMRLESSTYELTKCRWASDYLVL